MGYPIGRLSVKHRVTAHPRIMAEAKVNIHPSVVYRTGKITVGRNAQLVVCEGTTLNGDLIIGDDCVVSIGRNCNVSAVTLNVQNNGSVEIGDGVTLDVPALYPD